MGVDIRIKSRVRVDCEERPTAEEVDSADSEEERKILVVAEDQMLGQDLLSVRCNVENAACSDSRR